MRPLHSPRCRFIVRGAAKFIDDVGETKSIERLGTKDRVGVAPKPRLVSPPFAMWASIPSAAATLVTLSTVAFFAR